MPQWRFYTSGVTAEVCTSVISRPGFFLRGSGSVLCGKKKPGGSRPPVSNLQSLKSPSQRELHQPRVPVRPYNLAERTASRIGQVLLDIRHRGIGKVCMVPQVEEVSRKPNILPLPNPEVLQEGHIPVLLERSVIDVASQIAESRRAEIWICRATCRIDQRCRHEICRNQIAVGHPISQVSAR